MLYNFSAIGAQELTLNKGSLVEILRKEVGLWWFGRIKKLPLEDGGNLVEEILEPELGWFPKDFVRLIQTPETDNFYLQYLLNQQEELPEKNQKPINDIQEQPVALNTSPSSAATYLNSVGETTVTDQHNVTTIIIETPPTNDTSTHHNTSNISNNSSTTTSSNIAILNTVTASDVDEKLDENNSSTIVYPNLPQPVLSTTQSLNVFMNTTDILRHSAIRELLDTEVNYVKLLSSICEG